jgi:hypothetical protein
MKHLLTQRNTVFPHMLFIIAFTVQKEILVASVLYRGNNFGEIFFRLFNQKNPHLAFLSLRCMDSILLRGIQLTSVQCYGFSGLQVFSLRCSMLSERQFSLGGLRECFTSCVSTYFALFLFPYQNLGMR